MTQFRLGYRPDIDGLRAIAVGLVVIFHFRLAPLGEAGFMGVDVFFVISGFLITQIILAGLEEGSFRLGRFYLARIRRLYPALLTVLVLYLAAAWVLFLPYQFEELSIEAALSQLYLVNFYFWREVGYFGLQAKGVPLLHMWSLAVEEQFYIFYPLFLILIYRYARASLLPLLAGAVLASFLLGWFVSGWKPQAAFYLLPTRAWELGIGGLLAVMIRGRMFPQVLAQVAGPLGLALIAGAILFYRSDIPFPGWFALLPTLGAAALLMAGSAAPTPVSRLLSTAPMVWIGCISYPLYLVHWPVIILSAELLPEVTWGWRAMGLALSILLAWAILRLVETPVRSQRWLPDVRSLLGLTGALTAVLLAVSVHGYLSGGVPQRFDAQVLNLIEYRNDEARRLKACDWPAAACPLGPEGAPRIALLGDSHAWAFATGVEDWLNEIDQPGVLRFASGCMPVLGVGGARCAEFTETAIAEVATSNSISTVLLSSIWRQATDGSGLVVNDRFLQGVAALEGFSEALAQTVRRLREAGKSVVILEPFYGAPRRVPQTLARNQAFGRDWPTDTSLAAHRAHFSVLDGAFDRSVAEGAFRMSLIEELCTSGICPGTWEGTPVFLDGNHLRLGQSAIITNAFRTQFPQEALP